MLGSHLCSLVVKNLFLLQQNTRVYSYKIHNTISVTKQFFKYVKHFFIVSPYFYLSSVKLYIVLLQLYPSH